MCSIYKFGYTIDNKIVKFFVFAGALKEVSSKTPEELAIFIASEKGDEILRDIFSTEEQEEIIGKEIILINAQIHPDDTIETIKKKLILHCQDISAFDSIYLFTHQLVSMEPATVYQNLTQNGKIELTRVRLEQFIRNVKGMSLDSLPDKDVYDYDDIFALDLDKTQHLVTRPIGQKFVAVETTYPYTVDPYKVTTSMGYDEFLVKFADSITTTTNKSILMDNGPIHNNLLQICMAQDVLTSSAARSLSQESSIRIYYPFLAERGISDLGQLVEAEPELIRDSAKMIGNEFLRNVNNVNLFYNIYRERTNELGFNEIGVKSVELLVHPEYSFNLPLDVVFKLIHASASVPLIKYNPGKRQEKIYRLYADRMATNGKKIPSLSRAVIFKLVKTIGRNRSVTAYIEYTHSAGEKLPIMCEFGNNGGFSISAKFKQGLSPKIVDEILRKATEPIVTVVKEYLSQSGYVMNVFNGLYAKNTEIIKLEYSVSIPIKKKIALGALIGCVSSIFSVVKSDMSKGAIMRFKRVSNYNEMDSSEAFIVERLNAGGRDLDIIQGLMANYHLDQEQARERLSSFVTRLQLVQEAFQGSGKLKVKNNPGFLTTMGLEDHNKVLRVTISGINNIDYLHTIPIYIDALIRMTQSPWASGVDKADIAKLCRKKASKNFLEVKDIVAPAELPQCQQKEMDIVAEELVFDQREEEEIPGMMDILMMSDDEEEDEEDEEDPQSGGAKSDVVSPDSSEGEDLDIDITGMSLSNPNPFFTRMKDRDPTLFLVDNEGSFKSYSRICPWNVRRQPVILTEAEKAKIDAEHPGSYDEAVKYGTGKDNQYWYICPRYWSLRDGISLTEEEALSGDFGEIIPPGAKKVPPGGNVFQFSTGDDDEGYPYPGFLKQDSHPDGKCIPCCFKQWDSPSQKRRREACEDEQRCDKPVGLRRPDSDPKDDYIVGPDKFPLAAGRYGYLPLSLQKFLRTDNRKCQISATNTNLRQHHPCILRYGVLPSRNQSFIGALAAIWSDESGEAEQLTIEEMKEKLIRALDLDRFMALQNGNLVEVFDPDEDVDLSKYKDTKIYRNTNPRDPSQMAFFRKVVRSYENFLDFLRDDDIKIDYTYLWDLICTPNRAFFKAGLNLAILELKQDDMTDNVEIICPSNHYASTFFDANRRTAIIMKIGNYFEPIFQFEDKGKEYAVTRRFSTKSPQILPNLRTALELIKRSMNDKCHPLPSMPRVYKFTQNISLERLVHLLRLKDFKIISQVINYNGRVIGVIIVKDDVKGMVPCYPSAPMIDLEVGYTWLDESFGESYQNTIKTLLRVHNMSKNKIPCKPVIKIIEDGLIVGVLTQTNQFVPISPPVQDTFGDDLRAIEDSDYAVIDKVSITEEGVDNNRVNYIRRIRLETSFFNVFRNTVRILLGQFKHRRIREEIETLSQDSEVLYLTKLRRIDRLLRELVRNMIEFTEYDEAIIPTLGDITSCYSAGDRCDEKKFCITRDDGSCALVIPKINLANGQDNEAIYYGRLSDEIVRYSRIKSFIFQPRAYLAFSDLKYNLRDDEFIILQSLLVNKPDYFEGLIPAPINSFVKYNTYDTAQPLTTQAYSSTVQIKKPTSCPNLDSVETIGCPKPTVESKVAGKTWRTAFPTGCVEMLFPNDPPICSFDLILTLIKRNDPTNAKQLTRDELREILVDEYMNYYSEYSRELLAVLAFQGKGNMAKQVRLGQVDLGNLIMSADYYATNLDIWFLANRFNIPLIFYSGTTLRENSKDILVAHSDGTDEYYFVKSPAPKPNEIPNKYRLLVAPDAVARIPISSLSSKLQMTIRNTKDETSLDLFIKKFTLAKRKEERKKKLVVKTSSDIKLDHTTTLVTKKRNERLKL